MLSSYPVILLAGDIEFDDDLLAKLEQALKQGSTVLLTPAHQAALQQQYYRICNNLDYYNGDVVGIGEGNDFVFIHEERLFFLKCQYAAFICDERLDRI